MIYSESHREAKDFILQKIRTQAAQENILLSPSEIYILQWSDKDIDANLDQKLVGTDGKEISGTDYEMKIDRLIIHAYYRDITHDITAKERYRQVYKTLKSQKRKDRYLFLLVDGAIGRHFNRIGVFFGSYPFAREYLCRGIFDGVLALAILCGVIFRIYHVKRISFETFKEVLPQLLLSILGGAYLVVSYIRKYRRYKKEQFNNGVKPEWQ